VTSPYIEVAYDAAQAAISAIYAVYVWDSRMHSYPEKVRDAARWAAEAANDARKAEEAAREAEESAP
jgi:hypothetical protein